MQKEKHPPYQDTLFVDTSNGIKFVCGSSSICEEKEEFEGKEYPVVRIAISSSSHPFFTGSDKVVDSEGRVSRFEKKYGKMGAKKKED